MDATRFQAFLDVVEPERGATVLSAQPILGGYSRETVIAEVRWADGSTEKFILRGDPGPEDSVFRSDRDREWRLLRALHELSTFRIATPRWYDETGEHLGTKCIVAEAIPTGSMQALLDGGADINETRPAFVRILSTVHTTPLELLSDDIERPASWAAHLEAKMAVYDQIIEAASASDPVLRYVRKKMRANRPPEVPMALVHGDYQPSNILLPDNDEAVLIDWEFGHIGDPREDLGYYTQLPIFPQLYATDPEGILATYRELTGMTPEQLTPDVIEYFKLIGIADLLEQMMDAAEQVELGHHRGVMGTYLLMAITHFRNLVFTAARNLPFDAEVAS